MSTPIVPLSVFVYKIKREYESTGKDVFPEAELIKHTEEVVVKANEIDEEDYWILYESKPSLELKKKLSKICDYSYSRKSFIINREKYENGGSQWAEKIIGAMKYSFLKGSLIVLKQKNENKNKKEENETGYSKS